MWLMHMNLATDKVGSWGPAGGGMWGRTGPAVSPTTGAMYTGTGDGQWHPENGVYGNGIVGLKQDPDTKELKLFDYFRTPQRGVAGKARSGCAGNSGHLQLQGQGADGERQQRMPAVDDGYTKSIGGDDHRSALYETPLSLQRGCEFCFGRYLGIARDMAGCERVTRWLYSPFWGPKHSAFKVPIENGPVKKGGVMAFKVTEVNGKTALVPAWMSRDLDQGEPPVIANGVVFTYASGEATAQAYPDVGLQDTSQRRIPASTKATLYALDAETGKELWSSGDDIKSWLHFGELSVANGRVYIGTWDGILYCYGIAK